MMTPLIFKHANNLRDVIVTREQVWNIYYSEPHKATHLVSYAGAVIPVKETVDEAKAKVYGDNNPASVKPLNDGDGNK